MRWFKHMTDSSDDEFICQLEAEFGLEGYARWWKLLETIGRQMDKTGRCSIALPWDKWQTILKGKRKKLETFLFHLENKSKINRKQNGNILEIECPNLLKIRDDYSKKSGQAPDNVDSQTTTTDVQSTEGTTVAVARAHEEGEKAPLHDKLGVADCSNFFTRKGLPPDKVNRVDARKLYTEWIDRGVTLAILTKAWETAVAVTPADEISSPVYLRKFVLQAERDLMGAGRKRNGQTTVKGLSPHGDYEKRDYAADATDLDSLDWYRDAERQENENR